MMNAFRFLFSKKAIASFLRRGDPRLRRWTEAWYEKQERIDYQQTSSLLTAWKKTDELDFLNEVSCVPLQQCLRHLQKAFANFWGKRDKYPRSKLKEMVVRQNLPPFEGKPNRLLSFEMIVCG